MNTLIAVDHGGSEFRVRVLHEEEPIAERTIAHDHAPSDPLGGIAEQLAPLVAEYGPVTRVAIGASGLFGAASRAAAALDPPLRDRLAVREIVVADDSVTAFLGALGGRPGVACAVGTGAVTLAWDGRDRLAKVDGWGLVGGDEGSAYWIGTAGTRAALRDVDGRDEAPALRDAFLARYGSPEAFAATTALRTPSKAYVADFAPDILALAESGDDAASRICADAAAHLAESISTAARRVGLDSTEIALAGRIVARDSILTRLIREAVAASGLDAAWRPTEGTPLDGSAALATSAAARRAWAHHIHIEGDST